MLDIVIIAPNEEGAETCRGPKPTGVCPRREAGQPVPCAGRVMRVTDGAGRVALELAVERDATWCPLAALNLSGAIRSSTAA